MPAPLIRSPATWAVVVARWWCGKAYVGIRPDSRDPTVDELKLLVHAIPEPDKIAKDEELVIRVCGTRVEVERVKMSS